MFKSVQRYKTLPTEVSNQIQPLQSLIWGSYCHMTYTVKQNQLLIIADVLCVNSDVLFDFLFLSIKMLFHLGSLVLLAVSASIS